MWVHSGSESLLRDLGIQSIEDSWNLDPPGEVVNDRGDRQVLRLQSPGNPRAVYLKRWRLPPGSLYRCLPGKRDLRERARREKENLDLLREAGIGCPRPLAFGEQSGLWGPVASFLLLEELTDHRPACDLLPLPESQAFDLIRGMTEVLGRLHALNLFTRSPGLKHFFVTQDLKSFALIDVPRLDSPLPPWRERIKRAIGGDIPSKERDLSKLWVEWESYWPNADHWSEAFWEGYLTHFPSLAEDRDFRENVRWMANKRREDRSQRG